MTPEHDAAISRLLPLFLMALLFWHPSVVRSQIHLVSQDPILLDGEGGAGAIISGDGETVVFRTLIEGQTRDISQLVRYERSTLAMTVVSSSQDGDLGDGHSSKAISNRNASIVVFTSSADNLVPGFPPSLSQNLYVKSEEKLYGVRWEDYGLTTVDVGSFWLDSEGRKLALSVDAEYSDPRMSGVQVFVLDLSTTELTWVQPPEGQAESCERPVISGNGNSLLYDCNGALFVVDIATQFPMVVSADAGQYVISDDGNLVGYTGCRAWISCEFYVLDRRSGITLELFHPETGSAIKLVDPVLSGNGRFLVFRTFENLLGAENGDGPFIDVYRYDLEFGVLELVTTGIGGATTNGDSGFSCNFTPDACGDESLSISDDGSVVSFWSFATNLTEQSVSQANVYIWRGPIGNARAIPSLSQWGTILLATVVAIVGLVRFRSGSL